MTTIDVQGQYVVHTGDDLSFSDETAFQFVASGVSEPSELINKGAISASYSADGTVILGESDQGSAVFWNRAGATLSVSGGPSDTDSTNGFVLAAAGSLVRNDGLISVTSQTAAVGGWLSSSQIVNNGALEAVSFDGRGIGVVASGASSVVNHGLIDAGGVNATGLFLLAHTEVVNTGQIAVEASDLAQAIQDASGMSDIRNSGVIQAVDLDGADSRAILFIGGADSAVIENSGVISADTAIWVTQALAGTSIDITNSGQIFGKILLAAGDDLLDNSGAIVGDVDLGDGHDLFRGGKGQLDGALSGGGGADQLFGGAASELIYGDGLVADSSDGTDLLKGGHGDDTLIGGGGDDTLRGGADGDHLTGGAGSDVFLFAKLSDSAWSAPDLITDLEATDVIDISGIDADTTQAGDQAFHLVHALSGQAGEAALSYDRATHLTRLELDVDGDGHADAVIAIDGDRSDFTNFVL